MSVMQRMSDVVQEKLNAILGRVEDPTEAIDLAYEKQLESLQQVRRSVADVLTSEKRLELQAAELRQSQQKLQAQAREALTQGREGPGQAGAHPRPVGADTARRPRRPGPATQGPGAEARGVP